MLVSMTEKKKGKVGRPKGSGHGRNRELGKVKAISFELEPALTEAMEKAVVAEDRTKRAIIERALRAYFVQRGYMDRPAIPPVD